MSKVLFAKLNEDMKKSMCTTPSAAFVTQNPDDETLEQVIERQKKFLTLSENIKDKLTSPKTSEKIQKLGENYNLTLLQMAPIARAIRNYYFKELGKDNFSERIADEAGVDDNIAQEITRKVFAEIINSSYSSIEDRSTIKLSLNEALNKSSELADQQITNSPIKIAKYPDPVKPTVKNWLLDYHYNYGAQKHDSMERGKFLYRSSNAINLTEGERRRLAIVLKSYDEDLPLSIDKGVPEILFNNTLTTTDDKKTLNDDEIKEARKDLSTQKLARSENRNDNKEGEIDFKARPQNLQNVKPDPQAAQKLKQLEQADNKYSLDSKNRTPSFTRSQTPKQNPGENYRRNIASVSFEPRQTFDKEKSNNFSLNKNIRKTTSIKPQSMRNYPETQDGEENQNSNHPKISGNVVSLK